MKFNTTFDACAVVEGFGPQEASLREQIEAWGYLIKTGACWQLQGWYGRTAQGLIEQGYINRKGTINWQKAYQVAE